MGLLNDLLSRKNNAICETCGNLIKISDMALGCKAHDKLILPEYMPYHGNSTCPDWIAKETEPIT